MFELTTAPYPETKMTLRTLSLILLCTLLAIGSTYLPELDAMTKEMKQECQKSNIGWRCDYAAFKEGLRIAYVGVAFVGLDYRPPVVHTSIPKQIIE